MDSEYRFSSHASIISRQCKGFYDHELKEFGIGNGQQFFLIRINENPGISLADLSEQCHFDKSTITRAMKKLQTLDYIKLVDDEKDGRVKHIFLTDKATPIVEKIYKVRCVINQLLTTDLTDDEVETVRKLMVKVAENASKYLEV